jgi:hypothetical protein
MAENFPRLDTHCSPFLEVSGAFRDLQGELQRESHFLREYRNKLAHARGEEVDTGTIKDTAHQADRVVTSFVGPVESELVWLREENPVWQ